MSCVPKQHHHLDTNIQMTNKMLFYDAHKIVKYAAFYRTTLSANPTFVFPSSESECSALFRPNPMFTFTTHKTELSIRGHAESV